MSSSCEWIHRMLMPLPLVRYPFVDEQLPRSGIYFFYEEGEAWGHGGSEPRIVRVGTHRNNNFRQRIRSHFAPKADLLKMTISKPKPSDRSIFRKNIGRALLAERRDPYLEIWEIDFTTSEAKTHFGVKRNIEKEQQIEGEITAILCERFSFRFLEVEEQSERIGAEGLESCIIGALSACRYCVPSPNWLGVSSPVEKIAKSGLWLVQHLSSSPIDQHSQHSLSDAAERTLTLYGKKEWKNG